MICLCECENPKCFHGEKPCEQLFVVAIRHGAFGRFRVCRNCYDAHCEAEPTLESLEAK